MGNEIEQRSKREVSSLSQRRIGQEWRLHDVEGAIELCAGSRMLMAPMRFLWTSRHHWAVLQIVEDNRCIDDYLDAIALHD